MPRVEDGPGPLVLPGQDPVAPLLALRDKKLRELAEVEKELVEVCPPGTGSPLAAVSIVEAFAEPHVEIPWLIEPLLPREGLMCLSSLGGVGKSTLAVQMCASLAAGLPFLGCKVPRPVRCLIIEAEGSRHLFMERVRVALHNMGLDYQKLPIWFHREPNIPRIGPDLAAVVMSCQAEFVILDTIGFFHVANENSATELKAHVILPLRAIGKQTGAGFGMLHHHAKPSEEKTGRFIVRGSTIWTDDVDLAVRIAPGNGNLRTLHFDKIRYGPPIIEPMEMVYEGEKALFNPQPDAVAAFKQAALAPSGSPAERIAGNILTLLGNAVDGLLRKQLDARIVGNPDDTTAALKSLVNAGKIELVKVGRSHLWFLKKPTGGVVDARASKDLFMADSEPELEEQEL